jgi:general secretion pathway protein B
MLKQINIQDLQPGMVIVRITVQNGPVKIKKAGLVTSQDMVQGLIEMGIQQVEVDLDQTVELEEEVAAPKIKKSATRRMLESNKITHSRIQDDLPDQFHRNLYLPSVQDIPSAWQFYTKRYLFAVFIALGGLGFGWTLANYQAVLGLFSSQADTPMVSVSVPVPTTVSQVTEQRGDDVKPSKQVANPQDTNTKEIATAAVQQVAISEEAKQASEPSDSEQTNATLSKPEPEPEPQISADVLARFRKAMTEVEDSPAPPPPPVDNVSSSKKVPRIDQLPPWAMTRLPSMAFSAHMYASVESERWVRVNGTRMVEGDKIDGLIEIVRIEPQHVILNFSGQTFSMAALTDW